MSPWERLSSRDRDVEAHRESNIMLDTSFVIFVSFAVKNYLIHTTATDH
jgi:hypothetical protein